MPTPSNVAKKRKKVKSQASGIEAGNTSEAKKARRGKKREEKLLKDKGKGKGKGKRKKMRKMAEAPRPDDVPTAS
jgi:hypothetical protein